MPEIIFKDCRDDWILHYLADIVCGLISGDIAESKAHLAESGMDDHAVYELSAGVSQDIAERLLRGGKYIVDLIEKTYPEEFYLQYSIVGARLLPTGDTMIQYRRHP